jgi:peptidoglycan/xylan/chitin deacetylase (PgdA/CDA1 family)
MTPTRRTFLATAAAAAAATATPAFAQAASTQPKQSLIAISLDLEMARNFPTWDQTEWDYEKGNLSDQLKAYAVEAGKRVKAAGGVIHFFLVARALEQPSVDWLKELIQMGHRIGSHTYDHVYIRAQKMNEVQYRFARCPWLVEGKTVQQVIRENVHMATEAIKSRLGIEPDGFRAPGGFADGLSHSPDVRKMLMDEGFKWASTRYPAHPIGPLGKPPSDALLAAIQKAQDDAQPMRYSDGLIEVPMSPISDIGAFRNSRWNLDSFVKAIHLGVQHAIDRGTVFTYLSHPAVLSAMDPEFRAIDTICQLVNQNKDRAKFVNLDQIAATVP